MQRHLLKVIVDALKRPQLLHIIQSVNDDAQVLVQKAAVSEAQMSELPGIAPSFTGHLDGLAVARSQSLALDHQRISGEFFKDWDLQLALLEALGKECEGRLGRKYLAR